MAGRLCAMGPLVNKSSLDWYAGKRVFLTGHTGFKGAWLALWLRRLGAVVTGYALPPEPQSLFESASVAKDIRSLAGDVRDPQSLTQAIREAQPNVVFHLAAQSLVGRSYAEPLDTFATNVMGTANLLEAVRDIGSVAAVIIVTSDKCYENDGRALPYDELSAMGGHDCYSASKGCAELVTSAYSRSFFAATSTTIASARAGNVIGGGDWAVNRIIPDLMRAAQSGIPALIRRPDAIRPWQHVLEPLHGYLLLAKRAAVEGETFSGGWNFGPTEHDAVPVSRLVETVGKRWAVAKATFAPDIAGPHEAAILRLDSSKAYAQLGWRPCFDFDTAIAMTVDWYRQSDDRPDAIPTITTDQLDHYQGLIEARYGRQVA